MNHRITSLKKRIMVRIYAVYAKDVFLAHQDYIMFGVFTAVSLALVSIQDVFSNATSVSRVGVSSLLLFFIAALRGTSWIIQALIAGFLVRVSVAGALKAYKNRRIFTNKLALFKFRY